MQSPKVGARPSPLSRAQVSEVLNELRVFTPHIDFTPLWIPSQGDKDKKTSLKNLSKTDFFTKEIDDALIGGLCDIAIHSAKDLPEPLREGLSIIAITKGIDSRDAFVMPSGYTIDTLPYGANIGCSSKRREEIILHIRKDFIPIDIRGTIEERLHLLEEKKLAGLIIAEAALLRLQLHPNRILLPYDVEPLQGKLAIVARTGDTHLSSLFSAIDSRVAT
jgi:hydroxymethylbilane synthase